MVGLVNWVLVGVVDYIVIGFFGVLEKGVWFGNLVCLVIVVIVLLVECFVECSGVLCLLVIGGSFGV